MYPFYVLGISEETTDQEVKEQYEKLIRRYPQDKDPKSFGLIQEAYDAIATEKQRIKTQLFYAGKSDELLSGEVFSHFRSLAKKRPSRIGLQQFLADNAK